MELITDRKEADVLLGSDKGSYSCADLNRVEQAVLTLAQTAQRLDLWYAPQVKLDWKAPGKFDPAQWPGQSQMKRYLKNVQVLCGLVGVESRLPASMEKLTWNGANQIEKALLAVERQIFEIINTFGYSGEIFAGEETGI